MIASDHGTAIPLRSSARHGAGRKHPHRWSALHALIVTILVAAPSTAARVEIVLDASGSMRGTAGALSKMAAAKRAVRTTVEAIDPASEVALRLYGHRLPSEPKEPSCEDTELVIPFGPIDRERFVAVVDAVEPLGQTPLAHSLTQAAADFGELGDEAAAVILVSDGEESCGGDPAKVACAFAESGLALTVHTVGFDVDRKARQQLQAIADCTGGEYRDAKDADELGESLTQLTQAGLLVEKESAYGREIRGGDTHDQAVVLTPGVTYRLDHHQRQNQFDFFRIAVRGGQRLVASIETIERGVDIRGDSFRDTANPYAGIEVHGPDRQKIAAEVIIGTQNGKRSIEVPTSYETGGSFFVLVGNTYSDQHKDSRFSVELVDQYDAGSGQDAPADEDEALGIEPGEYTGWLHGNDRVDYYVFQAGPGAVYELRVKPEQDEKSLRVTVTDRDGVKVAEEDAPNAGAAVRLRDLRFPDGGDVFVKVEPKPFSAHQTSESAYTLELTAEGGAPAGEVATTGGEEAAEADAEEGGGGCLGAIALALLAPLAIFGTAMPLRRRVRR